MPPHARTPPPARTPSSFALGLPAAALGFVAVATVGLAIAWSGSASAREVSDLAGSWDLGFDRTGASCRVVLRPERSDKGDHFLAIPAACRHAMPGIAAAGRWNALDDSHITLGDPGGAVLLRLDADGDGFAQRSPAGTYTLKQTAGTPRLALRATTATSIGGGADVAAPLPASAGRLPPVTLAATTLADAAPRKKAAEPEDLPGRYAVMRDKRDTGCMVTLDRSRAKGGDRAQLAPGCRDQGIVVFDPTTWQLVRGDLVLTARAGHKTKLEKNNDGVWAKDAKEGGKPLGLKKL